jgi:hypothetical protein
MRTVVATMTAVLAAAVAPTGGAATDPLLVNDIGIGDTRGMAKADAGELAMNASSSLDPDLEPGFPVKAYASGGVYHGGPAIHALVGNIDGDSTLEILATGLAQGPLYAWNSDGSPQPGWPVVDIPDAGYAGLGELSTSSAGSEVFSGHFGLPGELQLVAYDGAGVTLPGWPRGGANYASRRPTRTR